MRPSPRSLEAPRWKARGSSSQVSGRALRETSGRRVSETGISLSFSLMMGRGPVRRGSGRDDGSGVDISLWARGGNYHIRRSERDVAAVRTYKTARASAGRTSGGQRD